MMECVNEVIKEMPQTVLKSKIYTLKAVSVNTSYLHNNMHIRYSLTLLFRLNEVRDVTSSALCLAHVPHL